MVKFSVGGEGVEVRTTEAGWEVTLPGGELELAAHLLAEAWGAEITAKSFELLHRIRETAITQQKLLEVREDLDVAPEHTWKASAAYRKTQEACQETLTSLLDMHAATMEGENAENVERPVL